MGFIRWGGKKYYPQRPKPYKPDINELMKPLSEKVGKGNIWGSVIMNVEKDGTPTPPPAETYHILAEDGSPLLTEGGDFIDYDYVIPPSPTPTPSMTASPTPTPTLTPTPTPSPSAFSPTDIPNLTNWWESDTGVITDGSGVLSWTDSISSNVATRNSINFNNTTDVLNGYTGITQTISGQMNLSSTINLSATTIFVVVKQDSIPSIGYIMGDGNSGLYINYNGGLPNGIYNNPDICDGGTDITTEQYFTYQMDATDYYLRQNGSQVGTTPIVSGGNITFTRLFNGNNFPFRGTTWEILIYDRALNGTEIGDVETYIQNKYGL